MLIIFLVERAYTEKTDKIKSMANSLVQETLNIILILNSPIYDE